VPNGRHHVAHTLTRCPLAPLLQRMVNLCPDALLDDGLLDFTLLFGTLSKQVSCPGGTGCNRCLRGMPAWQCSAPCSAWRVNDSFCHDKSSA
jgi:hypothetical protein